MVSLGNDWDQIIGAEFNKDYYAELRRFLVTEYQTHTVYPGMYDMFNALKLTPFERVKTVILGQDPYHGAGQAHGLAFSVKPGVDIPPSLHNIFLELREDLGCSVPDNGCLTHWAEQGVLLLNTILTVREGSPASHANKGWETFTNRIIEALNCRDEPVIFLLWGKNAREKRELINKNHHFVLESPHPSPLSAHRGFLGCRHFSKTNEILISLVRSPIDWHIKG